MLIEFGKLHTKVDVLLAYVVEAKAAVEKSDSRIMSLETTRTRQRAYWRSIVVAGSILTALVSKAVFFTTSVKVAIPPVP